MPPSLSRTSRYECSPFSRELLSPSRSALKSAELPQGYRSRIFLWLLWSFGKLDYAVNNILGHLVYVFACALRHEGNITTVENDVNEFFISK